MLQLCKFCKNNLCYALYCYDKNEICTARDVDGTIKLGNYAIVESVDVEEEGE